MRLIRLAYAALGFVFAGLGIWLVVTQHAAWWPLAVFALAPDVTMLFGFRQGLQRGQLDPRAVPAERGPSLLGAHCPRRRGVRCELHAVGRRRTRMVRAHFS